MKKRIGNRTGLIAMISFVLVLALGVAWATNYSKRKKIDANGGTIHINRNAKIRIPDGALDEYLAEQGIRFVAVSVELEEIYDDNGDLDKLIFTFGPDNTYFHPPLRLSLRGDYVLPGHLLLDESGEAVEYTTRRNGNTITFYIHHFSSYSYDHYDY